MEKEITLKWQEEINLYRNFKTTFVLEGEILDKQPYIDKDGDFDLMSLDDYFNRMLHEIGYRVVVFFNHVDGFYSYETDDLSRFKKIIAKAKKEDSDSDTMLNRQGRDSKFGDATLNIRYAMANIDEPVAIILDMASRYITAATSLQNDEQYFYSELFLASQSQCNPACYKDSKIRLNNLTFICADKLNDIPVWFYLNNPMVKTLILTNPDSDIRQKFLESTIEYFYGYNELKEKPDNEVERVKRKFVDLTDGFRNIDLNSLRELMTNEKISIENIDEAISLYKYGIKDNPWNKEELIERLDTIESDIKKYVKGQDICVMQAADIITRAVFGMSGLQHSSSKSKPRGIMFLAGPTGTGKTELAKSIARWLFGTEDACIRFDMSEYSQSHSDQRLLGAPPGYIGYESGGQLTNAVKNKPFSILLFDEIEKADKTILDKFLQILEDGRMTDGKGETVYFSDTVIIFTSNLGVSKTNRMTGEKVDIISYYDDNSDYEKYKTKVMTGIDDFFLHEAGRPEIKNRIGDNFIIFEYITESVGEKIADSQISKIVSNLKSQKNIELIISDLAKQQIYEKVKKQLYLGGRGAGNAVEKYLINPLARYLAKNRIYSGQTIHLESLNESNSITELVCEL